jgi:hypothetical protein
MAIKSRKKTEKTDREGYPRKQVNCNLGATDTETGKNYADLLISPAIAALRVLRAADNKTVMGENIDLPSLAEILKNQADAIHRNDMKNVEAMLINQSVALQNLFARLSEKALFADYVPTFETMMKLALRAQNQCRATLQTLAEIKNPPVVIARQANVTSGPQQINNSTEVPSRAGKNKKAQSKLSGGEHELPSNTGTPCIASQAHPTLEAVGKVHRAKVRRGKG